MEVAAGIGPRMIIAVNCESSQMTLLPTGGAKACRYSSIHCQRLNAMSGFIVARSLSRWPRLCEFFQQRLGLLQVGGVEALGEPAVDRREQLACFGPLALALPQAAQAQAARSSRGFACRRRGCPSKSFRGPVPI